MEKGSNEIETYLLLNLFSLIFPLFWVWLVRSNREAKQLIFANFSNVKSYLFQLIVLIKV